MEGVSISTLRDMEVLFDGIPLERGHDVDDHQLPGVVLLAFYMALADKRGIPRDAIGGTMQNDC